MESLQISATPTTPAVTFTPSQGILELSGRSTPEHPADFYNKLSIWIDQYLNNPLESTIIKIHLEYFNTSSSKYILELLKKLIKVSENGYKILVEWYHDPEDEDMRESGVDFKEILKIPFIIIEKETI